MDQNGGLCPFWGGRSGSPSNTLWPGLRPTSVPSFILIHPTVWPQYTNVTDRTDRQTGQWSDSTGWTASQTAAQKLKPGLVACYDIWPGNRHGLFWSWSSIDLSLTYLLRHLPTFLQPRDPHWAYCIQASYIILLQRMHHTCTASATVTNTGISAWQKYITV